MILTLDNSVVINTSSPGNLFRPRYHTPTLSSLSPSFLICPYLSSSLAHRTNRSMFTLSQGSHSHARSTRPRRQPIRPYPRHQRPLRLREFLARRNSPPLLAFTRLSRLTPVPSTALLLAFRPSETSFTFIRPTRWVVPSSGRSRLLRKQARSRWKRSDDLKSTRRALLTWSSSKRAFGHVSERYIGQSWYVLRGLNVFDC